MLGPSRSADASPAIYKTKAAATSVGVVKGGTQSVEKLEKVCHVISPPFIDHRLFSHASIVHVMGDGST
jgi:hypothetical protein